MSIYKPRRPKFDEIYQGEWDYPDYLGVGLSFEGVPNDYKLFLDLLMDVSCNPISARRILDILERNEIKYVTVMAALDFNRIGHELAELGVVMKITPPFDYQDPNSIHNNSLVDQAVLNIIKNNENDIELDDDLKVIFEQRLVDATKSFEEKPHNLGPYDRNYKRTY